MAIDMGRGATVRMLFQRRSPPPLAERLRAAFWPRSGWRRALTYAALRVLRLRHGAHEVALGVAIGAFAAITPLLGAQMALAGLAALALRASVAAALLATFVGNPLSWPVIWAATYALGRHMMGLDALAAPVGLVPRLDALWQALMQGSLDMVSAALALLAPVLAPMLAGSVPIGLLVGGIFYYIVRKADLGSHRARRLRPIRSASGELDR
ncbi:MAG: DUF2062 domain-containing protein [Pseudomonadota bacterium]